MLSLLHGETSGFYFLFTISIRRAVGTAVTRLQYKAGNGIYKGDFVARRIAGEAH